MSSQLVAKCRSLSSTAPPLCLPTRMRTTTVTQKSMKTGNLAYARDKCHGYNHHNTVCIAMAGATTMGATTLGYSCDSLQSLAAQNASLPELQTDYSPAFREPSTQPPTLREPSTRLHTHETVYTNICIYIYICMYICFRFPGPYTPPPPQWYPPRSGP